MWDAVMVISAISYTLWVSIRITITRIPNLQSESKNVKNWRNSGLKSVEFRRFLAFLKMCRFLVNLKNAPLRYSLNLMALHMQLDLVTRIPNLQTESNNVENWHNGDQKSVDFFCFLAKLFILTYLSTECKGTVLPARSSYQGLKYSNRMKKC